MARLLSISHHLAESLHLTLDCEFHMRSCLALSIIFSGRLVSGVLLDLVLGLAVCLSIVLLVPETVLLVMCLGCEIWCIGVIEEVHVGMIDSVCYSTLLWESSWSPFACQLVWE
jgi:hypothetical protein